MLLKDTSGNTSFTMTMATIAFIVVIFKILTSGSSLSISGHSISFGTLDSGTALAVLTPVLAAYTARRWGTGTENPPEK